MSQTQPRIHPLFSPRASPVPQANTVTTMTQIVLRLTNGTAPIRGMKVPGKGNLFSVYDMLWNTGAYVSKGAAAASWLRLTQSEHSTEVSRFTSNLKFPGPGQRNTPCTDVLGLQRILCLLGGKIGQQYRDLATSTLTRVAAGDMSLIEEIESNSVSEQPLQQMAREALAQPATLGDGDRTPVTIKDEPEELSEEALGQICGTNIVSYEKATVALHKFVEERRELIKVLTYSNPLLERDLALSRAKWELDQKRWELLKEREGVLMQVEEHKIGMKRKAEDESRAAITEFIRMPLEERKTMRVILTSQLEGVMPNKRARTLYVTSLMKVATPVPVPLPVVPQVVAMPVPVPQVVAIPVDIPVPVPQVVPAPVDDPSGVYVLKLSNGAYYVGQSRDIPKRIEAHKRGEGAMVAHDPDAVQVACLTTRPVPEDLESWERNETLELMYIHGIDKARGWVYNYKTLSSEAKAQAYRQICSRKSLCHSCGRPGHYTNQCSGKAVVTFGSKM